jgi:WD40 repeat protein
MAIFFPAAFPVFSVAWLGERSSKVLYTGGGGSAKSGVKNTVGLAEIIYAKDGIPTFSPIASIETGEKLCTCSSIDVSRGIQLIAGGLGDIVVIYGIVSGNLLKLAEITSPSEDRSFDIRSIAFDRSSGIYIACGDEKGAVYIYRLDMSMSIPAAEYEHSESKAEKCPPVSATLVKTLRGHQDSVTAVCFDSTGCRLCTSSKDGTCCVWSVESGLLLCLLPTTSGLPPAYTKDKKVLKQMCRACLFAPNADTIIYTLQSAARGPSYVAKWAIETSAGVTSFKPVFVGKVGNNPVTVMSCTPNGQYLILGDTQGGVAVIETSNLRTVKTYPGHQLPVSCLAVSTNSTGPLAPYDIISGSGDKTLILGSSKAESASKFATTFTVLVAVLVVLWLMYARLEPLL